MIILLLKGILIGAGATIALDIWDCAFGSLPGQSRSNWAPVGRWVWYLKEGKFIHKDINEVTPYNHELALGWGFHYAVGIIYGIMFAFYGGAEWFANPTFLPVFILGMVTVGAGWFILQPGLGIGIAASKLPNAWKVRILNIIAHVFFAIGMYGTAILLKIC